MSDLFGEPIPAGYDRVTFNTQVFQTGIPAAHLSPGVSKPAILMTGPDGVQRPLLVELSLLQCNRCAALVSPHLFGSGTRTHTEWHDGPEKPAPMTVAVEPGRDR